MLRRLVVGAFILLVLAMLTGSLLLHMVGGQGPLAQPANVVVPAGSSTRVTARLLESQGIVDSAWLFEVVARASGKAPQLRAGEYEIPARASVKQVLDILLAGKTVPRSLTIPEGYTVRQALAVIAGTTALSGPASPIPAEGRLFPDTYRFSFGSSRASLLQTMASRMDKELAAAWESRSAGTPYTAPDDLLIMASIVQKEAAHEEEMPQIAAVFVNRLRQGMKLQADPTVIYGAELEGNNIRSKDLQEDHPFNTYKHEGLPPTPIANPGRAALLAAARPAVSDALFFMALPDRSGHVFSRDYATHQKAVKAYWDAYHQQKAKE